MSSCIFSAATDTSSRLEPASSGNFVMTEMETTLDDVGKKIDPTMSPLGYASKN